MVAVLPLKSTVKTNRHKLMVTVNLVSLLGMLGLYVTHKDILKEKEGTYARFVKNLTLVTRLTRGVVTTSSLDFLNRTPYESDVGINR